MSSNSKPYRDEAALAELRRITDSVGKIWKKGTSEVLESRNPELLSELGRLEAAIDSLVVIPSKPAALKKQLKQYLVEYENTCNLCVEYASRHLTSEKL